MIENIKKTIRICQSVLSHPLLSLSLLRRGNGLLTVGKRLQINSTKFLETGLNARLGNDFRLTFISHYHGTDYYPKLFIGDNVFFGNRGSILCSDSIEIGNDTIIASDVLITSENHGIDLACSLPYNQQPLVSLPVSLGKNCWVGEKATILPGVTLGDNVIVAAHSVVTKSFPDDVIVAGIPARVIKKYNWSAREWESVER